MNPPKTPLDVKMTDDARKKRWAYLGKVGSAEFLAFAMGCVTVVCFVLAVLTLFGLFFGLAMSGGALNNETYAGIVFFMLTSVGAFLATRMRRASIEKADAVPYIPPVREQIAELRAEEILVRASADPAATPAELLRATNSGTTASAEGLLRASDTPNEGRL